jgi:hypothetical protein
MMGSISDGWAEILNEVANTGKFRTPMPPPLTMITTQEDLVKKKALYETNKISIFNHFQTVVFPAKLELRKLAADHPEKGKKSAEFVDLVKDYNQRRDELIKQEGQLSVYNNSLLITLIQTR